jgi:hypothetical protein
MEVSGQLHALGSFTPKGNSPWYPLYRRLGGLQSRSGCGGEEKNSGIEKSSLWLLESNVTAANNYTCE